MGVSGSTPTLEETAMYQGEGSIEEASHFLYKIVPEVTAAHLTLTLLPLFITFFGLYSGFIKEKLYVGEAIIATVCGIAFSGYAAGIFAPRTWSEGHHFDDITLMLTRIIIALSVFAIGVELPRAYVLRHWRSLSILLGPVMLFGWMVAGALIYALIPGLEFLPALVVAAGVTPTDPILASSVVGKGKFAQDHVPAHIRHLLQAESGANDGAAFPFLYLAMFLLLREKHSVGDAIGQWFLLVVLYQIVLGTLIGVFVGIVARKLLKFSKRRELIDRESMVAMYISLALFVTGVTTLAGSDDLLAAFACGTAFAWDDWFSESIEDANFSSTIDLLANCAVFLYVGATMPFSAWSSPDLTLTPWRLVVLALCILLVRRLPVIFLLHKFVPDIKTRREAIFAGHFGPMGVGAIFISTLAASKLPTPAVPPTTSLDILALSIQPITYFLVLSSILVHGLTIGFFSLGRRVHSRVTSMTRTFTATSGDGGEPSWMSRVKRARAGEEIVINRDDAEESSSWDKAEKGEAEAVVGSKTAGSIGGDNERVDGGASGSSSSSTDTGPHGKGIGGGAWLRNSSNEEVGGGGEGGSSERSEKEKILEKENDKEREVSPEVTEQEKEQDAEREIKNEEHDSTDPRTEHEREEDDSPPLNILSDKPTYEAAQTRRQKLRTEGQQTSTHAALATEGEDKISRDESPKDPDRDNVTAQPSSRSEQKRKELLEFAEPKKNMMPLTGKEKKAKDQAAAEAKYCATGKETVWRQGRKIIIDRNDGGDCEVLDVDPSSEDLRKAVDHPKKRVLDIPHHDVNREKSEVERHPKESEEHFDTTAIKRAAAKMMRRGSTAVSPEEKAEKEAKHKAKLAKDAWCRKEKHYKEFPDVQIEEGNQIITETDDEHVIVRDMTPAQKEEKAGRHLKALEALGKKVEHHQEGHVSVSPSPSRRDTFNEHKGSTASPDGAVSSSSSSRLRREATPPPEASTSSKSSRDDEPQHPSQTAPKRTGIPLTRTDRIDTDSEEDEDDENEGADGHRALAWKQSDAGSGASKRPTAPPRANSKMQAMLPKMFKRSNNESSHLSEQVERGRGRTSTAGGDLSESRANSQERSIRFAAIDKPNRDGIGSSGRALPVVGSSLSVRRVPTKPKD